MKGGRKIPGLADLGQKLAARAALDGLDPGKVKRELERLTWNCPAGCDPLRICFWGPGQPQQFPALPADSENVYGVSPFIDQETVRRLAIWGNASTKRTLISTTLSLEKVSREAPDIFSGFERVLAMDDPLEPVLDKPEIEEVGRPVADAPASAADVEIEPLEALHAKMFLSCKGSKAKLWIGSANATQRGWSGRNYEAMVELAVSKEISERFEELAGTARPFVSNEKICTSDPDEEVLDRIRKSISDRWNPEQRGVGDDTLVFSESPPDLAKSGLRLEVGAFGGGWHEWPQDCTELLLKGLPFEERTEFIQAKLSLGRKACSWLQRAPCNPPPGPDRDCLVIARHLDYYSLVALLRSVLVHESSNEAFGSWDDPLPHTTGWVQRSGNGDSSAMLTIEEILRAYARAPVAFHAAQQKVRNFLGRLEKTAQGNGKDGEKELLQQLRETWELITLEL